MNCFETELYRAIISLKMLFAVLLSAVIVKQAGIDSELYQVIVPVVCTFPYTTALLEEYDSGFIRVYLLRCKWSTYTLSKLLACMISGGIAEVAGIYIYSILGQQEKSSEQIIVNYGLLFMSGMLWALVAAVLCVCTRNRYVAYGGSFVIYYVLVILCERYIPELYSLDPIEWYSFRHEWIFGKWGIVTELSGICLILMHIYTFFARRMLEGA